MFGKDDLETGMLVKFKCGRIGIVLRNCYDNIEDQIVTLNGGVCDYIKSNSVDIKDYNEYLEYGGGDSDFDISEVCKPYLYPDLENPEEEFRYDEVIWKRN